jgi:nicotinamidase-related amidase/alkylated DNA repair dioxygenase AlkB
MMSSLADLLAQNQPRFQTHPALLVIGLQNDFIQPDGRLPVDTSNEFLDRINTLIPKFRQVSANVIWIQTVYEADRLANDPSTGEGDAVVVGGLVDGLVDSSTDDDEDSPQKDNIAPTQSRGSKHKQRALDLLKRVSARRRVIPREEVQAAAEEDEELFLWRASKKGAACLPNTPGADFTDDVKPKIEASDTIVQTSNYSAFQGTSLLLILRAKLVTELYICGCITNVSVLATVIDAARHGIKINVVQDCLGFRRQPRHDIALKRMVEFFDAYVVTSSEILNGDPPGDVQQRPTIQNGSKISLDKLEDLVDKLKLGEDGLGQQTQAIASKASTSKTEFPAITVNGRQRTPSDASRAESRATTDTKVSDDQFAELLTRGAQIPVDEQDKPPPPKQSLVKAKIRMRTRSSKSKKEKEEEKKVKSESKKGDPSSSQVAAEKATDPLAKSTAQTAPVVEALRPPTITKAESSDRLRESPFKRQQSLKSSASQPALSAIGRENTLRSSPSRMRLALSRSSKSESKVPPAQKSPASISEEPVNTSSKTSSTSNSEAIVSPPRSTARSARSTAHNSIASLKSLVRSTHEVVDPPKSPVKVTPEAPIASPKAPSQMKEELISIPPPTPTKAPALPPKAPELPPKVPELPPKAPELPSKAPELETTPQTSSTPSKAIAKSSKLKSLANLPVLGPGDTIAEGDSRIIYDFFPANYKHPTDSSKPLKDLIFQQLYNEVRWQKMLHQTGEVPRLVCCQGLFGADGSMPVYRHPTDQALPLLQFSPQVKVIQRQAEKLVGHPLNHVLIQLYRSGQDFISEHSDKTLDILKSSSIVNVSFGAQRTMRLRKKKADKTEDAKESVVRDTQRVAMPHNSMFVLGLKSNQRWVHGINPDKRLPAERSEFERAYGGARISLTFRNIGTFLDAEESKIWGQGATSKEQRDAQDVINDDESENECVVRAFSRENHQAEFDWDEWYGNGYDVLHFRNPPEDVPILFGSNNPVKNKIVQLFLSEAKINHTYLEAPALEEEYEQERQVCYRDNDVNHTQAVDAVPIICYLNQYHPIDRDDRGRACTAASYEIFATISALLKARAKQNNSTFENDFIHVIENLEERLSQGPGPFIAGRRFSIGDCAAWPALDQYITKWDDWSEERFPHLTEYYKMLWKKRKSVAKLRAKLPDIRKKKVYTKTEIKTKTDDVEQLVKGVTAMKVEEEV